MPRSPYLSSFPKRKPTRGMGRLHVCQGLLVSPTPASSKDGMQQTKTTASPRRSWVSVCCCFFKGGQWWCSLGPGCEAFGAHAAEVLFSRVNQTETARCSLERLQAPLDLLALGALRAGKRRGEQKQKAPRRHARCVGRCVGVWPNILTARANCRL